MTFLYTFFLLGKICHSMTRKYWMSSFRKPKEKEKAKLSSFNCGSRKSPISSFNLSQSINQMLVNINLVDLITRIRKKKKTSMDQIVAVIMCLNDFQSLSLPYFIINFKVIYIENYQKFKHKKKKKSPFYNST